MYFLNFVFFFEKNKFGDFDPEFGENLQTQGLSLENSPNSGSKSPNSFVSQKNPNSEVEFGVFSKVNG